MRIEKYTAIEAATDHKQNIASALPKLASFEVRDYQEDDTGSCDNPDDILQGIHCGKHIARVVTGSSRWRAKGGEGRVFI